MSTPSDPTEHLKLALEALVKQRDTINNKIDVVANALKAVEADEIIEIEVSTHRAPSVPDVVLDLLRERDEIDLQNVLYRLEMVGNAATHESVSSTLSRMVSNGLIDKGPRRGTWKRKSQVISGGQVADLRLTGEVPR